MKGFKNVLGRDALQILGNPSTIAKEAKDVVSRSVDISDDLFQLSHKRNKPLLLLH